MAKGTTAFVSVSNTCLTARLAIAVFYVPLPTIGNVEICWKRRKIGHYRAVQFSEREAVSISPKQSVVGSTPTGLNPQTSNSFWLMFSRASCQTRKEHRLERIFCFLLEIDVLLHCWRCWQLSDISPFLPTPLFWQTGDLPNISVRTVPAIFYAPHFYTLFSAISRFWGDKINNILE